MSVNQESTPMARGAASDGAGARPCVGIAGIGLLHGDSACYLGRDISAIEPEEGSGQ